MDCSIEWIGTLDKQDQMMIKSDVRSNENTPQASANFYNSWFSFGPQVSEWIDL